MLGSQGRGWELGSFTEGTVVQYLKSVCLDHCTLAHDQCFVSSSVEPDNLVFVLLPLPFRLSIL